MGEHVYVHQLPTAARRDVIVASVGLNGSDHRHDAFATSGTSPTRRPRVRPSKPANYRLSIVTFSVVREAALERDRLDSPDAVADLARSLIPDDGREHFGVLLLNAQNRLIGYHEVSIGTVSASLVDATQVYGTALRVLGVASLRLRKVRSCGSTPRPGRCACT